MSDVTLRLTGTIEEIPDGDKNTPAFLEWCDGRGVVPGEAGPRGWWTSIEQSLWDSKYFVHLDMGGIILLNQKELDEMLIKET